MSGQQCHRAQQICQLCKILFCVFLTLSSLATEQVSNLQQCPSLAFRQLHHPFKLPKESHTICPKIQALWQLALHTGNFNTYNHLETLVSWLTPWLQFYFHFSHVQILDLIISDYRSLKSFHVATIFLPAYLWTFLIPSSCSFTLARSLLSSVLPLFPQLISAISWPFLSVHPG